MTLLPPKPIVALGISKTCIEENIGQTRIVLATKDKPLADAIKDATGVASISDVHTPKTLSQSISNLVAV